MNKMLKEISHMAYLGIVVEELSLTYIHRTVFCIQIKFRIDSLYIRVCNA